MGQFSPMLIENYQDGARAFITAGPSRGVANYLLEEASQDVPTFLWGFFGIYPKSPVGSRAAFLAFTTENGKELSMKRALQLQLPERIKRIELVENPDFTRDAELVLATSFMPSKLLAFGERVKTKEDVTMLFCLAGIKPETALREIQQRIREAQAKHN